MTRFLKRTLFMLVPATLMAFVLWVPASTSDLGLQNVTLSCTDGTLLDLELDAIALTALADAVVAINLYPAGDPPLACSLSQSSASSGSTVLRRLLALLTPGEAAAGGNPQHDYAVGGGQVQKGLCTINFALSAHVGDTDATSPPTSGGTFNLTEQQSCLMPSCAPTCCICGGGHLVAKPDCLHVEGDVAQLSATVTHSDGSFNSFSVGSQIYVEAQDDPDMIGWTGTALGTEPCDACPATMPLLHGNVSVHDADCPGCTGTPCIPTTPTTTTRPTTTTTTATTSTTTSTSPCLNATPACAGPMRTACTCGGDCTSQFCDLSGGSPGFCAPVCADSMPPCGCNADCSSGSCVSGRCQAVSPPGPCECGGDCTSQNCQGGICKKNCVPGPCMSNADCSSGSCVAGFCAPVLPGGSCGCGGDCTTQFCDNGTCGS